MKGNQELANQINLLGQFCGVRDLAALSPAALQDQFGSPQADVMVLFGGSILCGGDVLAQGMQNHLARHYLIVGGAGHTTERLRQQVQKYCPQIDPTGLCEAEIFAAYLKARYDLVPEALECKSTNCGNNITNLLTLLRARHIVVQRIILCQDATMQRRMAATLSKFVSWQIINYATYALQVVSVADQLSYAQEIWGMWDLKEYLTLLMGEIPRLMDNRKGYGPRGKNYLAHVNVPPEVGRAFRQLQRKFPGLVRPANPAYHDAR